MFIIPRHKENMNLSGKMSISFCMKDNRKKRRENYTEALRAKLSTIGEPDEPVVRMWGKAQLEVENHSGVLEFTQERIRLYTSVGIIKIEGRNLNIALFDSETAVCSGEIRSVSYEISGKG